MPENKIHNKMTDLNDLLFAQLERINDESLKGKEFDREIERSKAIAAVAGVITKNAEIAVKAAQIVSERQSTKQYMPDYFQIKKNDD